MIEFGDKKRETICKWNHNAPEIIKTLACFDFWSFYSLSSPILPSLSCVYLTKIQQVQYATRREKKFLPQKVALMHNSSTAQAIQLCFDSEKFILRALSILRLGWIIQIYDNSALVRLSLA